LGRGDVLQSLIGLESQAAFVYLVLLHAHGCPFDIIGIAGDARTGPGFFLLIAPNKKRFITNFIFYLP
jgi:hypothetical protein